jgi:hypothetical protein
MHFNEIAYRLATHQILIEPNKKDINFVIFYKCTNFYHC